MENSKVLKKNLRYDENFKQETLNWAFSGSNIMAIITVALKSALRAMAHQRMYMMRTVI